MYSYKINLNRFEIFWFNVIRVIFNISGITPFRIDIIQLHNQKNKQREYILELSYSLKGSIYSFCLSSILFYTIHSSITKAKHYEGFSYIESLIRLTLTYIQTIGVINVSQRYCFQQRTILKTINELIQVEMAIKKKLININNPKMASLSVGFVIIFFLLINIVIAGVEFYLFGFRYNVIIHSLPWFVMTAAFIQYTLILIYIRQKIQNLNQLLLSINHYQVNNQDILLSMTEQFRNKMTLKDVLFIQQTNRKLYKLINFISNFYASIILFPILQGCLGTTYDIFGAINELKTLKKDDVYSLVHWLMGILWLIRYLFPLVTLSGYVNEMISEMKRTGLIIYKASDFNSENIGVKDLLHQFSMELLHSNRTITVYGLFSLSSSFITSITGVIITYMITLIQVKDSF